MVINIALLKEIYKKVVSDPILNLLFKIQCESNKIQVKKYIMDEHYYT